MAVGGNKSTLQYNKYRNCRKIFQPKNNGSIGLKLEHIVVYENSSDEFDIEHCHGVTSKFLSIYHNTNCQGLYLSFGTC